MVMRVLRRQFRACLPESTWDGGRTVRRDKDVTVIVTHPDNVGVALGHSNGTDIGADCGFDIRPAERNGSFSVSRAPKVGATGQQCIRVVWIKNERSNEICGAIFACVSYPTVDGLAVAPGSLRAVHLKLSVEELSHSVGSHHRVTASHEVHLISQCNAGVPCTLEFSVR